MNPDFCQMAPKEKPKITTVGERDYHYGRRDELADILESLFKNGYTWTAIATVVMGRGKK